MRKTTMVKIQLFGGSNILATDATFIANSLLANTNVCRIKASKLAERNICVSFLGSIKWYIDTYRQEPYMAMLYVPRI